MKLRKFIDSIVSEYLNENIIDKYLNKNIDNNDVNFVFKQHPELKNIGTPEQYSQYLDTIFPNSKVKNVVYHAGSNKIETFRENHFGVYFGFSPTMLGFGNVINSAIVNTINPLIRPNPDDSVEIKQKYNIESRRYYENTRTYDSSIESSTTTKEGVQLKINTPEQIHVLGTNKDLEGFKNYLNK
jgi:hypothetical protein